MLHGSRGSWVGQSPLLELSGSRAIVRQPALEHIFRQTDVDQRANRIVLWRPQQAAELLTIGEVQNPCGLWPLADAPGVAIGGGLGLARWHPRETAQMMRWPTGMAAGNHWALLA